MPVPFALVRRVLIYGRSHLAVKASILHRICTIQMPLLLTTSFLGLRKEARCLRDLRPFLEPLAQAPVARRSSQRPLKPSLLHSRILTHDPSKLPFAASPGFGAAETSQVPSTLQRCIILTSSPQRRMHLQSCGASVSAASATNMFAYPKSPVFSICCSQWEPATLIILLRAGCTRTAGTFLLATRS